MNVRQVTNTEEISWWGGRGGDGGDGGESPLTAVSSGHEYKSGHFSLENNYFSEIFFANSISTDI